VTFTYGNGGFGGGAPADYENLCNLQAGAGGGYNGASGVSSTAKKTTGYGGSSYNSGLFQFNQGGKNSADGYIMITYTISCNAGFYLTTGGSCAPCLKDTFAAAGANICSPCAAGNSPIT
jgi:hypothetical protein